ncbi:MAG: hypothetical protein PHC89_02090 [Candidatus Pacebacteria bacterium]|nr:hypothetical protein [Candidatus Paceibacterota bacterium]
MEKIESIVNPNLFLDYGKENGKNDFFKFTFLGNPIFKIPFLFFSKEFEPLKKVPCYEILSKAMNNFGIKKYYGEKIIKEPQEVIQEMHYITTCKDTTFTDEKINLWNYKIPNEKLFYLLGCIYNKSKDEWIFFISDEIAESSKFYPPLGTRIFT